MHAKACHWPDGEWGSSTCCHMNGREFPELVLPDRALHLPDRAVHLRSRQPFSALRSLKCT